MLRALIVIISLVAVAAAPPMRPSPAQEAILHRRSGVLQQALSDWKAGRHERGIAGLRQALGLAREVYGEWSSVIEHELFQLGLMCRDHSRWEESIASLRELVRVRDRLHGAADWKTTDARWLLRTTQRLMAGTDKERKQLNEADRLHDEATHLANRGQAEKALPLARRALELRAKLLGERHPDTANTMSTLGFLHSRLGDHRAALEQYVRSAALRRELLGENHPDHVNSLDLIATLRRNRGDVLPALDLYLLALQLAPANDVSGRATLMNNLGTLYSHLGDHLSAVPLHQRALEMRRQAFGEKHPHYANSLNNLAGCFAALGESKAAMPLYHRLLAIREAAEGKVSVGYADGLNNLAGLLKDMGDYKAALPLYQEALAIREKVRGRRHVDYAQSLNNLAIWHVEMGEHKTALGLHEKARVVWRDAVGIRDPQYAFALNNIGWVHHQMGRPRAALPLMEQALTLRKATLGEHHPLYAQSLNNLSLIRYALGDHVDALALAQRALDLRRAAVGPNHPAYAVGLANLAAFYHEMNRPSAALVLQEQALVITQNHLALNAAIQSERQQVLAADAFRYRLNRRLSMPDESASFSHAHVLAWKGGAFAAQRSRRDFVRLRGDVATRALADEVLDATRELALLSGRSDARSRERLQELIRIKDEKEGRLAALSDTFRSARTPPTTKALRRLLPAGVVVVDWLTYSGYDPNRPIKGQEWENRLSAWVLRGDRATVRVELGEMAPIEKAVTSWRRALEKGDNHDEAAALLRKRVWLPLEKHLAGAKHILISPDGALARLPFGALPGSKEGTYLLEEVPLSFLPVPRMLPELLRSVTGKPSLITLGGVDFDASLKGKRRERGKNELTWAALPGTRPEGESISTRFKGTKTSLSGKDATKDALRLALTRHRTAHLATHGYFAPVSMRSALERTDEKRDSLFQREGVSGWHPGLLSGLVLAGANRPTDEDDGVLTASEIAEMDLSNLDLAVLSACETGLGKEAGGEGMLGLQRAFAVAGCKSVVSSLWSVHDGATSVLMERFYHHHWDKKLSKLEALRQAQLDVLHHPEWVEKRTKALLDSRGTIRGIGKAMPLPKGGRRGPPAWWAAWQLSGDWR